MLENVISLSETLLAMQKGFIRYSELFQKKTDLFKEQNAGFSAQIHSVTDKNLV